MKLNQHDLVDLVERTEKAARRRHKNDADFLVSLVAPQDGRTRLIVHDTHKLIVPGEYAMFGVYHKKGGQFPVYVVRIGGNYEAVSVTELRIPRGMPREEDDTLVTHNQ